MGPLIRGLALALWGAVLLSSSLSGRLELLLRGVFHPLVTVAGGLLLALGVHQMLRRPSGGWKRSWLLAGAVAVLVLLIPPNPSFSDLASNRSSDLGAELELDFQLPPGQRSLTDWVRLLRSQPDPQLYAGDPVRISGFVLPQPGDRPQLGRLLVRCCLADATPIGLPVRWPAGYQPQPDQWLAIDGRMGVETHRGIPRSVVLVNSLRPIPRPARPLEP